MNEARLDRLAHADVVGDEHAYGLELERHQERHEPVRPWLDRDARQGAERAGGGAEAEPDRVAEEAAAAEVLDRWRRARLDEMVDRDPDARRRRHDGSELPGVIDDLADLGVMQRLRDGRINVPDVVRLRFGIKRKGGVPARRA